MSKTWNVGDPCFIVRTQTNPDCIAFGVLPATVVQIFGSPNQHPRAIAYTKWTTGSHILEGQPFKTEVEARIWLSDYVAKIVNAASAAPLFGERPEWKLPDSAPKQGDVVYTLDLKRRELLEVVVGIVRIESGRMEVGYDKAPGNPEASIVRMRQWWPTREAAETYLHNNTMEQFRFVSKEELARRVSGEIDQSWLDAAARVKDPAFLAGFTDLTQGSNLT